MVDGGAARPGQSTQGGDPDPRFSLANERTFLAYNRTALALVVAGLAVSGSHAVVDASAWVHLVGVPFLALGATVARESRRRLDEVERALRLGEAVPAPRLAGLLATAISVIALVAVLVVTVAAVRSW